MTDEIEYLTMLYSKSSKDLISLTLEHRKLGTKFDSYFQKSEQYMKQQVETIAALEEEVKDTKDKYESFDVRFKKKDKECKVY
jgi:hypothetical protein